MCVAELWLVLTPVDRFAVPSLVRTPRSRELAAPTDWAEGSGEGPAFRDASEVRDYPPEPTPYRGSLPSMHELATISRTLATETSLVRAAAVMQSSLRKALRVADATCVWIDWPGRIARTITGRASPQVEEIVLDVAGRGKRQLLGAALIVPIGRAPARAVLALRKPGGLRFESDELAMIDTLAAGIAPAIDRLVVAAR